MKESDRIVVGGVTDCFPGRYQYSMSPARVMNYTETVSIGYGDAASTTTQSCTTAYPSEWTRAGGSCTTFPSVNLG